MRILTVRQPWAGAIIHRGKDVENRVRNIAGDYRGPVAIHVGLRHSYDAVAAHNAIAGHLDLHSIYGYGSIIGVVHLIDVHPSNDERCERFSFFGGGTGPCSDWAELGAWHLEFANPRPLAEPIPYKGALGLRTLDAATVALITKQVQL